MCTVWKKGNKLTSCPFKTRWEHSTATRKCHRILLGKRTPLHSPFTIDQGPDSVNRDVKLQKTDKLKTPFVQERCKLFLPHGKENLRSDIFFNAQGVSNFIILFQHPFTFSTECVCVYVSVSHNPLFFSSTTSPTPNLAYFAPLCFELMKMLHFWTAVLEKTLERPWDSKDIKPVDPKGNQPWIFIGRTDAKAESPTLWPSDAKSQLIGKDLDAGRDWGQKEKGTTEDEIVGWHHQLTGHEFEKTLGHSEGQGSLVCCSPWGHRVGHNWVIENNVLKNHTF